MKRILIVFLTCFAALETADLSADTLPLFFSWDSSYAAHFKPESVIEKDSEYSKYVVVAGIDTTWADAVRTCLAVTNEQSTLDTQVLLKQASVSYQYRNLEIRLAMEDKGYGGCFELFNRRVENPLYLRNALLEYRWQGVGLDYHLGCNNLYAGLGDNHFNGIMYNLGHQLNYKALSTDTFIYRAQMDDRYNTPVYHYGTELQFRHSVLQIKQGFVYNSLPLYKDIPASETHRKLTGWHYSGEVKLSPLPVLNFTLSGDWQKPDSNHDNQNRTLDATAGCDLHRLSFQAGLTRSEIYTVKGQTYHLDASFTPVSSLRLGGFFDWVDLEGAQPYHKLGIQTSYIFPAVGRHQ